MRSAVEVAEAEVEVETAKSGTVPPAAPATESFAHGVVAPSDGMADEL
jgi:hypothetical protein